MFRYDKWVALTKRVSRLCHRMPDFILQIRQRSDALDQSRLHHRDDDQSVESDKIVSAKIRRCLPTSKMHSVCVFTLRSGYYMVGQDDQTDLAAAVEPLRLAAVRELRRGEKNSHCQHNSTTLA